MTTTDHFQTLPTFYNSADECVIQHHKSPTNPRYSNFTQFCFTAGDIDQFETYRDPTNGSGKGLLPIDINLNRWKNITDNGENISEHTEWLRYKNISTETIDNTFRYIFEKFKKGLFIKIKDNKLSAFLPFSKHSYVNEWSRYMKQPPSFKTMTDFLIYASKIQGYNITEDQVNKFPNTWYGNNCLVRTEFPVGENDRGLANFKDMLETLCAERTVPDIELFINKRDFPILRTTIKGLFEPYDHIYGAENFPLISHRYETYCPILSMVTTDANADVPMPTAEDWARVSSQESKKYFAPDCRDYNYDFSMKWEDRIPTAVFRGASTGCGTTIENNPRLKLAMMSTQSPVEDGKRLLDAGITKWNVRPRKHISSQYLQIINPKDMPFELAKSLTPSQQASYKYIVHVDGHVSAFRLSLELSMGSVLLIADSKYRMWFKRYLVPNVHFVPVKEDLSDLYDKIRWCRQNDQKCKEIAENAKIFYNNFLRKDGILDYMQLLLIKLKKTTGTYFYNSESISSIIKNYQLSQMAIADVNDVNDEKKDEIVYPYQSRNPNALGALQHVIRDQRSWINKNAVEVKSTNDTKILTTSLDPYPEKNKIIIKKVEPARINELVNEGFCGMKALNQLFTEIPNFRYTYGVYDSMLYMEYVEGVTFKQFIESPECDMDTFAFILTIISMSLAVAQERCGFVHYDLYPWNIIIVKLDTPQTFVYRLKHNVYNVTTSLVPVLIDYGRSHIISKNDKDQSVHTGTIEPFKASRYQDVFCIVVSSVVELLLKCNKSRETHLYLNYMTYLVNFFTGTDFYPTSIKTREELQKFLSIHKKYNEMIYGSKCNLEQKNPIEFFYYIANGSYNKFIIENIKDYGSDQGYPMPSPLGFTKINSMFYLPILKQEKHKLIDVINKYLKKYEKCFEDLIKQCKHEISACYTLSMFSLTLDGVQQFMKEHDILDPSIQEVCDTFRQRLNRIYKELNVTSNVQLPSIVKNDMLCLAKYTPKTFSIPEKILTLLEGTANEKDERLIAIMNMFILTSFYSVPYKISRQCFLKNKAILEIDPLVIINHNANMNTLKIISEELYPIDIAKLSQMEIQPEKTLTVMNNVLNLL
jgi:hypothetical protein